MSSITQKPSPPSNWQGVRKCVRFGARAPQADYFWERWTLGPKNEGCLFLNVFTPTWKPENEVAQLHGSDDREKRVPTNEVLGCRPGTA